MSFCPNDSCKNYGRIPDEWPNQLYDRNKFEAKGTQRFICKARGRTFSSLPPKTYEKNIKIAILRFLVAGRSLENTCSALCLSDAVLSKHIENITKSLQEFENKELAKGGHLANANDVTILADRLQVTACSETGYLTEIKPLINEPGNIYSMNTNVWLKKRLGPSEAPLADLRHCDPNDLKNILDIHRIWFNFRAKDRNNRTAAMKTGISGSPIDLTEALWRTVHSFCTPCHKG